MGLVVKVVKRKTREDRLEEVTKKTPMAPKYGVNVPFGAKEQVTIIFKMEVIKMRR